MPKIAIVILNWNGAPDTLTCLRSLELLTYPDFEIIVVDNGSTDDSARTIQEEFPHILLLEMEKNLGFAEGSNVGMRVALQRGANYLFLLNNDTIVATDILERFVETFEKYPQAGILGSKIFLMSDPERLDHLGGSWNPKTGTFDLVGLKTLDQADFQHPQPLDYVCGAGLMIKGEVIDAIGYLEPAFFLIWEEADLCFRARRAGFHVLTCPEAKVWHKVSASFVGKKPHSTYFWWRGRLLWIERNCTPREKWSLYLRVLIPDILHMLKMLLIKKNQLKIQRVLNRKSDFQEKTNKLLKNQAALCGVRDYLFRKFDQGPDWILFDASAKN